jgi:CRISPR-associated protein (TIGR03984 family)
MTEYAEYNIRTLNHKDCQRVLDWVTGDGEPIPDAGKLHWLLAHCQDGVTWGKLNTQNAQWQTSSKPFPNLCPPLSTGNLLELRVFGPETEILIWRVEDGFKGRFLTDAPEFDETSPIKPAFENRILLGNRFEESENGFTRISSEDGRKQAVPLECDPKELNGTQWPLRLKVRHYFEQDDETGEVRAAASRLVDVYKKH